jgi:hypothetical protein
MHSLLYQRDWNNKVFTLSKILFPDPPHKALVCLYPSRVCIPVMLLLRNPDLLKSNVKTPMLIKDIPCTTRPAVPFHVLV